MNNESIATQSLSSCIPMTYVHLDPSFCPELLKWPRRTMPHRLMWRATAQLAPCLQPGWPQPSVSGWPPLWLVSFSIIPLPFGLDDCIWLTYFLTLGTLLCFSTGAL